jgi:hypothetical protein
MKAISRRTLIESTAGAVAALVASAAPLSAAEDEINEADKIKQPDAKYQNHPNGPQRCEICLQFMPPAKCKIVQGPINPKGWCQFFAARENAR